MYELGQAIGALVAMFLLSRPALWLAGKAYVIGWWKRVLVAHGMALAVATLVGGIGLGFAHGGRPYPRFGEALAIYGFGAMIWLAIDLFRFRNDDAEPRPKAQSLAGARLAAVASRRRVGSGRSAAS
jgi:threonine/homoserine/homoserine lactone efflux protein